MNGIRSVLIAISLLVAVPVNATAEEAEPAEAPGEIRFKAKNLIARAKGIFHEWEFGEIRYRDAKPGIASAVIQVDVASIDTGINRRDNHLRSADFFEVEKYPTATIRVYDIVTKSESELGNSYVASIDFQLHGVQKAYDNFEFRVVSENPLTIEGQFDLDRMDFAIGKPKSLNPMSVSEIIPIAFAATIPPPPGL